MAPNLHLAHISDLLLTWTVFCYAFAMLGYALFVLSLSVLNHIRAKSS